MNIGIDIRPLEGSSRGGVAEYTKNMLPALIRSAPSHDFFIFCNSYKHRASLDLFDLPNVRIKEFHYPNKLFNFSCRYFNYPKLDKLIGGLDVFFSPHFFPAPVSSKCKKITTFHDISFELFPEFFNLKRRVWHKYINPEQQAKTSDAIIAVSDSTKKDLEDIYGIDSGKVFVVYSGTSVLSEEDTKWKNTRSKYKLTNKYILALNTIEPRKNMISAVRAFNAIAEDPEFSDVSLVIAGSLGWSYKPFLKELDRSPYKDRIILTGPVLDKEKALIYKNALVFIYPSLYEGFGFPPLEAMSQGTPAIVSFSTSLPEVTGGAALMVDPTRPKELAGSIKELLQDKELYNQLKEEGKKRSRHFTWEKAALKTLQIIEDTAS